MVEAATPQNSMMTDGLRKYLAFSLHWFLGGSKEDFCAKSDNKMNCVVKKVWLFFPGLLRKKIIVSSTILVSNHLRATFDFNAGDVDAAVDDKSSVLSITCFMMSCEPI